jgi:hypothetical protein
MADEKISDLNGGVAVTPALGDLVPLVDVSDTTQSPEGTTSFTTVGLIKTLFSGYVLLQDRKTQGTNGGTFTSGARRTRDLTTEVFDTASVCTLSSNQFTLLAGTYRISAVIPACRVNIHQAWLYNVTDAADVADCISTVGFSANTGGDGHDYVFISGNFTIAGTKTFEIQHQCGTTVSNIGFGNGGSGTSFAANYFTTVELWVV